MCCFSNIFADISGPKTEKESSRKDGGREPERGRLLIQTKVTIKIINQMEEGAKTSRDGDLKSISNIRNTSELASFAFF